MKIAATIARYLLGIMFTVFGLNGFFHFIPQPPPAEPLAIQYMTVMATSHYLVLVFLLQIAGGVLLLLNRFVPLALALLAPVIVNILLFHFLINPAGIGLAVVTAVFWGTVFFSVRSAFAGLFQAQPPAISDLQASARPASSRSATN